MWKRSPRPLLRRRSRATALVVATLLLGVVAAIEAQAAAVSPRLELIAPPDTVTLWRYAKGEPIYMDLGLMVAALDAPLELVVQRPDYSQPPILTQVLRDPSGDPELRVLDPSLLDEWKGLKGFFDVEFTGVAGETVVAESMTFCPGGYRERVDDSGPDVSAYPAGCFANPFTKGAIWGVDRSWAVSTADYQPSTIDIPNGRYEVSVHIADLYVDLFGIDPAKASADLSVRVKRMDFGCEGRGCGGVHPGHTTERRTSSVPTMTDPDPAALPDLIALPSWGIAVDNLKKRSLLTFGATVWNGGASNLVVEGFRRPDESVMDAFQYFYDGSQAVGKAPVGELEFDSRDGHDHWHFKQFAAYSLLDSDMNEVRVSRKEAFCLAPTDSIDLTLPHAEWNPGAIGLYTACGSPNSIWVRETLHLGWGDTYYQGLPGQSFNISSLPNGTYYIRVEANPGGLLHEQSAANNVELREIHITGTLGKRLVEVPPWNGIDSEAGLVIGSGKVPVGQPGE